jgi:hypothetical protein
MTMTTQQLADYETLSLTFYRVLREVGGRTNHAPSSKQIAFWVDMYGFAATERGIEYALPSFLEKMKDRVIRSEADGIYMINYLGCAIRSTKESIVPARTEPDVPGPPVRVHVKSVCPCGGPRKGNRPDGICLKCGTYAA